MPCCDAASRSLWKRGRAGFSLVELLVVIGIIALLIAILLPTLAAARRQANLLQCGNNLRTLAQACMLHAQEHRNFLPLAGMLRINMPTAFHVEQNAAGLGDAERKRYTYAGVPNKPYLPTPLPASLAPYLTMQKLRYDDWNALDRQLNDNRGVWKLFMCPETDALVKGTAGLHPVGQLSMMCFALGPAGNPSSLWATNTDFGINEGLLGFDFRYPARRLAGNQSRITRPAETMLLCDAINVGPVEPTFPSNFQYAWGTFAPALESTGPVTLADVLQGNAKVMTYRAQFDKRRHRGRMNIVFADGHVEAVHIARGDLERVFILGK